MERFTHHFIRLTRNPLPFLLKYTPPDGTVHTSFHTADEKSIAVSVKDTGIGISEKDLSHIFERFYRGDPSRPKTGAGLGLSLAQAIAQAHGGNIHVTSSPGKGSTFTVTLPKSPNS
jgi:signal transduction histidine kinase